MDRDANRQIITSNTAFNTSKSVTFAAATTGSVAVHDLMQITGDVMLQVYISVQEDLTSGGESVIDIGITTSTGYFISTAFTNVVTTRKGTYSSPFEASGIADEYLSFFTGDTKLVYEVETATLTGGTMTVYCLWRPLSENASVVAL